MKVSIIIPTYNCGNLLTPTLNSIRMGGWSEVEVIVCDGLSSDDSLSVLDDFPDLDIQLIREEDEGQYDAINKGMGRASGEVLAWINAGDFFLPGAIANAVEVFQSFSEVKWLTGRQCVAEGVAIRRMGDQPLLVSNLEIRYGLCEGRAGHLQQEGMFWRRELWESAGPLDTSYKLAADFELWIRFSRIARLARLTLPLAAFSYHATNRSIVLGDDYRKEVKKVVQEFTARDSRIRSGLTWLPFAWRIVRKVPLLRSAAGILCRLFRLVPVEFVSYRRKAGGFGLELRNGSAWFG